MANETTYALISALLPDIWEAALMFAQENFALPNLVTVFDDQMGMQDRKNSAYAQGTVVTGLAETTDLTTQALSRSALATLTPAEAGTQYVLTDRRRDSDDVMNIAADIATVGGYAIFKQIQQDLHDKLGSLTLGTIGAAGSVLQWSDFYKARAILAGNNVPGPYSMVLHEYTWYQLATAANIVGIASAAPLQIRDDIQGAYYLGSVNDMNIYVYGTDTAAAGTAVTTGVFSRQAIALDIRRGLRIEPERDASNRWTEFNITSIYATGAWRPLYGVQVIGDASVPS